MSLTKLLIGLTLLSIVGCLASPQEEQSATFRNKYVIEAEDLKRIIDHDSIIVLDLQHPEDYEKGHIPGAINIWRSEVQNDSFPYSGMLANRLAIEELFGKKGVSSDKFLVLYDNRASCEAARLWWVLRYFGYEKMAILNGGSVTWASLGPVEINQLSRPETKFRLVHNGNPKSLAKLEDVENSMNNSGVILLDTRTTDEYSGRVRKKGAMAAGHIPKSKNLDWMESMDGSTHKFRSLDEIKSKFDAIGINTDKEVIAYCHSGVRSAHTYFVLTQLLGYENVRNYDGSWVEWTFHEMPIESDSLINL